ncbi:sugar transferase [Roseateles sp.]|uniref:sugar transferase n=1 Tax=Roseateles sp. TaxID=1971397 RepID=UPI003BA823EA
MAKRLFDLFCAGLGLLLLSPLLLVVAIWIKLDSPGPVMFRQERVGRFGKPFHIHKFRSMRVDAPALGPQITIGQDPRITRSGRWLRASKIDELPQLWDVFRGAMSLVGPRPEVPRYVALYTSEQRELVLSVRPGITDPASLQFRNESEILASAADPEREYVDVIMPAKLQIAGDYVRQASVWTDLRLILVTLGALGHKDSYSVSNNKK